MLEDNIKLYRVERNAKVVKNSEYVRILNCVLYCFGGIILTRK
jgi:hypothetical protein